jgi:cytidylate kinase
MKYWITGYVGSGKSTISKQFNNIFEFDLIEDILKEKGYELKSMSNREFRKIVKKELKEFNNIVIEGIQCCEYYKKGDKVYFVPTSFWESSKRSYKRDGKRRRFSNLADNIFLAFKLKKLYLKVLLNGDLIKNTKDIKI